MSKEEVDELERKEMEEEENGSLLEDLDRRFELVCKRYTGIKQLYKENSDS